jgi:phage terminase large subunit GpA-like protein
MSTVTEIVSDAFVAGFRPEPEMTVSEWADRYRYVSKPSPEPGFWRTSRVPYMKEVMDRLSPSDPAQIIVLAKAAQGAGTEGGINAIGCWMHRYPDSIQYVLGSIQSARRFVSRRLDPMIQANEVLRNIVSAKRSRGSSNTTTLKEFGDSQLVISTAASTSDARADSYRYQVQDEVDSFRVDLNKEGSSVELFMQRTAGYRNRKVYLVSTPTLYHLSQIWEWFQRGDQNYFHLPCPRCGAFQALIFGEDRARVGDLGGLRWDKGDPASVRYQCEKCGGTFEEWEKVALLQNGVWIPSAPGNGAAQKIRTYQINALYYPYGWPGNSWLNLAAEWEKVHKDPVKRKTFVNLKQGLPYSDPAETRADADTLIARREAYGPELPPLVAVLTAGADVHAERIDAVLVGWGADEESWRLERRSFLGDTSEMVSKDPKRFSPWEQLETWLHAERCSELGLQLSVKAVCIDSGYKTQTVVQFCGERKGKRVWATKGREGNRPIWAVQNRRARGKFPPPNIIGVDVAKERIYARLRMSEPGPGAIHFPLAPEFDRDYFEQLTAEVRVPDYTGPTPKYAWKKRSPGAANHMLDCDVQAYAALIGWQISSASSLNREVARVRTLAASVSPAGRQNQAARDPAAYAAAFKPIVSDNPYL